MDKGNNSPTSPNEQKNDNTQSISCSLSATTRQRRVFRPTNASSFENYVRQEFTILRASLHQISNTICEVSAQMKQISKNELVNTREISTAFPRTTVKDLEELDKNIGEEPNRYIELFKKLLCGAGEALRKILKNFYHPTLLLNTILMERVAKSHSKL